MDGEISLLEDQKFFIDRICDIVSEKSVDAVLIAGDVYDRSVASAEAIRLYDHAMTRLCSEMKVPVIVIAGNHDSAERLSSCRELLSSSGLYISGALEREVQKVTIGNADIYLLPWITEEKVKSVFPEHKDEIASLENAYQVVTDHIREDLDAAKRNIIVSHAFITDSETSESDRAASVGSAARVSAEVFDGFDYAALGHIHKPQSVSKSVRYSGTPMPYSFGKEETQEKSVTVFDTDDLSTEIVPLPLLHLRTTLTGTLDELRKADYDEAVKNGYVRLRITDQYPGLETLSELRLIYPNWIDVSGKTFDNDDTTVTMTMEELERLETDPVEVFRHFCADETDAEADDYLIRLFRNAVEKAKAEVGK